MDEHRRRAAQEELGRRHPYLTVYGRTVSTVAGLAGGGLGVWWAWQAGTLLPILAVAMLAGVGAVAWLLR